MKRWLMLAALAAGQVMAQSADISGTQLLSGDADARLQALAREAAAANRKLVISAPEYWHEMILEQVRRGGGDALQVEVRDSFAEAVMVRSDSLAPAAAEPAAPVAASAPAPAPAPVPRPASPPAPAPVVATPAPAPRPATPAPQPAPGPASPPQPAPRPVAPVAAQPAPTPAPAVSRPATPVAAAPAAQPATAQPATPQPATAQPATPQPPTPQPAPEAAPAPAANTAGSAEAETTAIRRRFEQSLNRGEPITRTIRQGSLEPQDVLYVRGDVIAVQRRDSLRSQLYWLEGGIELMRVELRETGPNRYLVMEPIRNVDNPRLRAVRSEERELFTAAEPARHAEERATMERRYNGGNPITATLAPTQLDARDVLYVGDELAVVVRVSGLDLQRYFLLGRINLGRSELLRDGNNKYRVLRDIRQ